MVQREGVDSDFESDDNESADEDDDVDEDDSCRFLSCNGPATSSKFATSARSLPDAPHCIQLL